MRFSVRLIQHLGTPREVVNLAVLADQMGFDQAWFPSDKFMYNAWSIIAAVAENTENIVVGANGTEPYAISPAEIAAFMATLDHLSQGRVAIGFGMHTEKMVNWLGHDTSDRLQRITEACDLMRRLWRGENAQFDGDVYHWSDQCYMRFKPFRDAIPIYVSGFADDDLELSGVLGDGSLPMVTPPESASLQAERILRGVRKAGKDPTEFDICGCAWFSVTEDGQGTMTDTLKDVLAYFGHYMDEETLATVGLSQASFAETQRHVDAGDYAAARAAVTPEMAQLAITGSPKDAIAKIEMLADAGVTQVSIGGPLGPDPAAAIRLIGEKVIPYFR
ncbi:LLM class flavin-dependent oxidoreductase [Elongatibacter sediminis]|uniref:LLM class flavin-dependent oxidoreductase n=1 Tax=Elongatibacter sediminis TaxID=3119006 RepID=A0AAW9RD06_9GAMM